MSAAASEPLDGTAAAAAAAVGLQPADLRAAELIKPVSTADGHTFYEAVPHPQESKRLEALSQYVDTRPSTDPLLAAELQEFVLKAKEVAQTKMALVSLVDQNIQVFKARTGLDASHTDRCVAFCAHALHGDLLIVKDATTDKRFMFNPLVTGGPNVRFYAGITLKTHNGLPLGTLCCIDDKPRPQGVHEEQLSTLRDLADSCMEVLERYRGDRQASRAEQEKKRADLERARADQLEEQLKRANLAAVAVTHSLPLQPLAAPVGTASSSSSHVYSPPTNAPVTPDDDDGDAKQSEHNGTGTRRASLPSRRLTTAPSSSSSSLYAVDPLTPSSFPKRFVSSRTNRTYTAIRVAGSGHFKNVYEGIAEYGQRVAINVWHRPHSPTHEAFLLEKLYRDDLDPHRYNVTRIFDHFQDEENRTVFVCEYAARTVRDDLDFLVRYNPKQALIIMACVLRGLFYLRSQLVVHGDLKSENLLLVDDLLNVRLNDFGLAVKLEKEEAEAAVDTVFTPILDPEARTLDGQRFLSHSTDIYAAGLLAIELVTGVPVSKNGTEEKRMRFLQLLSAEEFKGAEYDGIKEVVRLCTCKKAERPSARELLTVPCLKDASPQPLKPPSQDDEAKGSFSVVSSPAQTNTPGSVLAGGYTTDSGVGSSAVRHLPGSTPSSLRSGSPSLDDIAAFQRTQEMAKAMRIKRRTGDGSGNLKQLLDAAKNILENSPAGPPAGVVGVGKRDKRSKERQQLHT